MKLASTLLSILVLVACGSDDDGNNNPTPDAPDTPTPDGNGGVDAPDVPATITISGTATSRSIGGEAPVADATIEAFASSNEATPVATATTDAQGNFTLTVTTNGAPLDGFLKASKAQFKETYLYPPAPIVADTANIPMNMITPGNYDALSTLAQGNQQAGQGVIALVVVDGPDSTANPVSGATVASTPAATYRYNGSNGLPSSQASSTGADGVAYMFNVPPGAVTVEATKTGSTFQSHAVKSFADQLTTTVIVQ